MFKINSKAMETTFVVGDEVFRKSDKYGWKEFMKAHHPHLDPYGPFKILNIKTYQRISPDILLSDIGWWMSKNFHKIPSVIDLDEDDDDCI